MQVNKTNELDVSHPRLNDKLFDDFYQFFKTLAS